MAAPVPVLVIEGRSRADLDYEFARLEDQVYRRTLDEALLLLEERLRVARRYKARFALRVLYRRLDLLHREIREANGTAAVCGLTG